MQVRDQDGRLVGWYDRALGGGQSMTIMRQVKVPPEESTIRRPCFEEIVVRQGVFSEGDKSFMVWFVDENTWPVMEKLPGFRPTGRTV